MTYISLLFLTLLFTQPDNTLKEPVIIQTYEEDVTGNGNKEQLELKGILFSEEGKYFQSIWMDITSPSSNQTWRIDYGGGYEPELQFTDLTGNGIKDIFYQSPTGGSGGLYTSKLHEWQKESFVSLPLPTNQPVKGEFMDHFQVSIQLIPNEDPVILNVSHQKEEYTRLKLYNDEGELLAPTMLMIDPVAFFKIIELEEEKRPGLISYQQISGAYHADHIGTIESTWVYHKDKWILLHTTLKTELPYVTDVQEE